MMMTNRQRRSGGIVIAAITALLLTSSCVGLRTAPPISADRAGLTVTVQLSADAASIDVSTVVRNERAGPVYLVPDQCGRITEAVLARTQFEPEGNTWQGSVQALKQLVLDDQRSQQHPDKFHPRRPDSTSSDVPPCTRPDRPVEIGSGQQVAERWELPLTYAYGLDAVGSAASVVRVETVEARSPNEMEFLDVVPTGSAESERAGRNLRIELPASDIIQHAARSDDGSPSLGELYDRLLESAALRGWIEAQPADGWRLADLRPASPFVAAPPTEQVQLRVVNTAFETAARVTARADGTDVSVDLPAEGDRTRAFERGPGTTPPGIALITEPDYYAMGDDIDPGLLKLPSGRVVAGEYLLEAQPLDLGVAPGSYPVHGTLARYRDNDWQDVALATLVLSGQPTVRWQNAGSIAVDGGSATFTSPEGVALLSGASDQGAIGWDSLSDRIFDSRVAHDYLLTEFALSPEVNLIEFSSGVGDGGYPIYVGYDAAGAPTQVVIDFLLLHLAWPE